MNVKKLFEGCLTYPTAAQLVSVGKSPARQGSNATRYVNGPAHAVSKQDAKQLAEKIWNTVPSAE